jgi:hypothetical protein
VSFPVVCFASTLFLSLCTGVRLMWVARRTRGFPEQVVGTACTLLSLAGACDVAAASAATPSARLLFGIGGHTAYSAAAALMFIATQRIFRDRTAWAVAGSYAGAGALALVALVVAALGPHITSEGRLSPGVAGSAYLVGLVVRLTAYGWLASEALAAHRAGRRALRFGFVDPLAVQQFLLWAVSAAAMGAGVLGALYARVRDGLPVGASAFGLYTFSALGVVGAAAAWLAFFPPRAYVRRILARARSHDG